jgi:serine protease Do
MNHAFRRFLALVAAFAAAFITVTALRTWRSGGDFSSWIFGKRAAQFQPESFTLTDKAPLELNDVELLSRMNNEYAKLTEAVVPSVVSISTAGIRSEQLRDWWGQTRTRNYQTGGQGSGVIVTEQGHLLTNHHVIANQQKIQVTLHSGKTYNATLVGEDTLLDIAVLKIDSNETFTPLKLGDSSQVKVGQMVFAVGNPFGLGETVTQGIISAKERSLSDNQRDLFQTDAAINPGNSGGPLVNLRGEIIGINVAIFSRDQEKPAFQGVGFSIPSNDVKESLIQILERGRPIYSYFGVHPWDLNQAMRATLGYHGEFGVAVLVVNPGSPAESAGLQPWDVVRTVNGETIKTSSQLIALLQRAKVGSTISLEVWRKGEPLELKATIAEGGGQTPISGVPPEIPENEIRANDPRLVLRSIGIQVRDLSVLEQARGYRGVLVTAVSRDGTAASLLRSGDLIAQVNGLSVRGAEEFLLHLAASAAVRQTSLTVARGGRWLRVDLPALPQSE